MFYAGIGSRETPKDVRTMMYKIGAAHAKLGLILRSGGAIGADIAFERGCNSVNKAKKEIFYATNDKGVIVPEYIMQRAIVLAGQVHPAWHRCSYDIKRLHARNCMQILGRNLDEPVDFVVCWTEDGGPTGGTGQAIRLAMANDIPIYNLYNDADIAALRKYYITLRDRQQAVVDPVTRIDAINDAFFGVIDNFIENPNELYSWILNNTEWEQFTLGNGAKSPRLNKSYGKGYNYSGKVNAEVPMPQYLVDIANRISNQTGFPQNYWNQVLLNYYRDGKDSIGAHSDSEKSLGSNPRVCSISLGATRTFLLHPKNDKNSHHSVELHNGQLFLMGKDSQLKYLHSIPKEPHIKDGRISITFRHVE